MNELQSKEDQFVSVIITSYNHARYLPESIESVLAQTYRHFEILVVDDGSTDNTQDVVSKYPEVRYIYKHNQGLSAARNTGIDHSKGSYLVFLDADDWLLPEALAINVKYLNDFTEAAFVSGAHTKVNEHKQTLFEIKKQFIADQHYKHLLHHNYIEMHAAVMYRRWVFDHFRFDTTLRACEDYDIYLKIARQYPIVHHMEKIAVYRKHTSNMSGSIPLMINSSIGVLQRQKNLLQNEGEEKMYREGMHFWKKYYSKEAYRSLRTSSFFPLDRKKKDDLLVLFRFQKVRFIKLITTKLLMAVSSPLKKSH